MIIDYSVDLEFLFKKRHFRLSIDKYFSTLTKLILSGPFETAYKNFIYYIENCINVDKKLMDHHKLMSMSHKCKKLIIYEVSIRILCGNVILVNN